jgi:hypothetical protein
MRIKNLVVLTFAIMVTAAAMAATKTSGTATCKLDPPSTIAISDQPNHAFSIGKAQCTWTKFELAGVPYKDGVTTELDEVKGDTVAAHGYHVATLSNGDTATAEFHGSWKMKDGKAVSGEGTWIYTSGTGKLKSIKGKGTYKGTANPDGSVAFQVEGEYSLP